MAEDGLLLAAVIFALAVLYSSVGHAGASGYLAAMALFGIAPEMMRPAAFALNVLVASLATWRYARAGRSDWRLLIVLAAASMPAAFVGGWLDVPPGLYRPLVGALLLLAALRMALGAGRAEHADHGARRPALRLALVSGAGLGFLGGITGTGGGIFLAPLLLILGWAETRTAAGVTAAFILVNSTAALTGIALSGPVFPPALPLWAAAALAGASAGTWLGIRALPVPGLRYVLALVLVLAGGKMLAG